MESQPQNPEFRNNSEKFHPYKQILSAVNTAHVHLCIFPFLSDTSWEGLCHTIVLRQQSVWNIPLDLDG